MKAWEPGWAIAVTTTTTGVNVCTAASWPHMGGYRRLKGSTSSGMRRCCCHMCAAAAAAGQDSSTAGSGVPIIDIS